MDILQKAEIHFYGRGKVSLYLQSNSSDQGGKFGEIALAAFHSVRMMSNLGHRRCPKGYPWRWKCSPPPLANSPAH